MAEDEASVRPPAISVVVLAGGQGRRLGLDKALLEVQGQPLLVRTVQTLAVLSDDVLVVANDPSRYEALRLPARLVADEQSGMGALMGLLSGLKAARHSYALAVACDMPFLSLPLLRHMVTLVEGQDVVIPRLDGMLEPLHAIYGKSCLPFMARLLEHKCRQIIAFFREVKVRYVDEHEVDRLDPLHLSFVNVNTPGDWERVQTLLAQQVVSTDNNSRL